MNDSHLKRLALVVGLIVVVVVSALYLVAKPPSPSPALPPATANPVPQASTTSTQPKITWSVSSVQPILSRGESSSSTLRFVSDGSLPNVTVEAVPEIAPFVTISPSTFASVSASQTQSIQITSSIPQGTTLGTYDGTIHLRVGSTTLPQTLKVTVNVWQGAELTSASATIDIPPGWLIQATTTQISASSPALQNLTVSEDAEVPPEDLLVRTLAKPSSESIDQFASSLDNGTLESYATKSVITVDGHEAVVYSDVNSSVPHQPVLVAAIDDPVHSQALLITFRQVTSANMESLFLQFLSAIQFH